MGRKGVVEEAGVADLTTGQITDATHTAKIKEKRNSTITVAERSPWSTHQDAEGVVVMDKPGAAAEDNGQVEEGVASAGETRKVHLEMRSNGGEDSQLTTKLTRLAWKRVKVEKENGGTTAGKKTCFAKTPSVEIGKMCHFVKGAASTTTGGNGATKEKKKVSTLPVTGATTDGAAHP
jgi:hypothetical protein